MTNKEDSDNDDEDCGPISYSLPTLPRSPQKEQTGSMEEEEAPVSYQDQMRQTGMMGIPPPPNDESYWPM